MTDIERLIQNAADTAQRMFPAESERRAEYEAELLRSYLRALGVRLNSLQWEAA